MCGGRLHLLSSAARMELVTSLARGDGLPLGSRCMIHKEEGAGHSRL